MPSDILGPLYTTLIQNTYLNFYLTSDFPSYSQNKIDFYIHSLSPRVQIVCLEL